MVVKISTKKPISKLILVVSLLVTLMFFPSVSKVTSTTNALELSITSIEYEFEWLSNDQNTVFQIFSNITIENTSFKNITVTFADGCLWDTQIECSFKNESLNYSFGEGMCTLALAPLIFQPGITRMVDFVKLQIYNYTLAVLPEGRYTIIVGEEYNGYYKEIKDPGKAFFEVKEGILIDFEESSFTSIDFTSVEVLMISIIILPVVYRIFRKREKKN